MTQKYSKEHVISKIHDKNPLIDIIGNYIDTHTKVLALCNACGNKWMAVPQKLMRGINCPSCAYRNRRPNHFGSKGKSTDEFKHDLYLVNPNIEIISEYVNSSTRIQFKCKVCGTEHSAEPTNLLSGCGCPTCAKKSISEKQLKSNSQFVSELEEVNPSVIPLEEYKGNKERIMVQCAVCRNKWSAMPVNLLRKDGKATGCPSCSKSHGEDFIKNWLEDHDVGFVCQYSFEDLLGTGGRKLSYDFFLPHKNTLIEYQGEFHDHSVSFQTDEQFERQVIHDRMKFEYANKHGYNLLQIWYFDNKEEKLKTILT